MEPTTKIVINGVSLSDFSHLRLVQRMYEHHSFEIVIGHDVIEEIGSHTLDKSKDWIGKSAVITLGENDFVGIVTNVNMAHNHGLFGDLIIKGYSNTILLDGGEHIFSWTDKSFKDVIKETIDTAGIGSEVKPEFKGQVAYMAQHSESHFTFLRRLAKQYNEWMFYDGEKLIYGKPDSLPTVPIAYGTDLDNIQVSLRMRPVKYSAFSYSAIRDEQFDGKSKDKASGQDELGSNGFTASTDNFGFSPHMRSYPRTLDKGSLDDMLEKRQQAASANLSQVSGSSSKQELRPGVIADIKANIFDNKSWSSKTYGQYLITAVHHHATGDHVYSNHFEGIPAGVKSLPEPNAAMPSAYPQIATVLSNDDPDQKGRIQVQFQWQIPEGLKTNWIRVMTPDAGKSDLHPKNRGHVFIPEVGDQVMVGFRYGDPSRPFVMGSMFHGMNGAGGNAKNVVKSIITRSGHELVFDDTEGGEKITIVDKNKNTIIIDTKSDSIYISANANIELSATNIIMNASDNIKMEAGKKITAGAGDSMALSAENSMALSAGEDIQKKAGRTLSASGGKEVKIAAGSGANMNFLAKGEIMLASNKKINVNSKETTIVGTNKATIKSKKAFMEGTSKAVVKGSLVDIS